METQIKRDKRRNPKKVQCPYCIDNPMAARIGEHIVNHHPEKIDEYIKGIDSQ